MSALARRTGFRLFRFFSRELGAGQPDAPPARVDLRLMPERDVLGLCEDRELDLKHDGVRAAYARGDLCVGALDSGRVVGYCWLAFAPLHHLDGVWVEFGPSVAWTYKSLVRSSHRGKGIAPSLYRFADEACRGRGRSFSVICIESHNSASAAAALRAGYRDSGYALYLRSANSLRWWSSPAARRQGIRFNARGQ
jgi:GNAT superfamily N-acetyltransferase